MTASKRTRKPNGTSSVYFGSDGYWHTRVTVGIKDDGTPDRRHRKSKTEAEANKKARKLERHRDEGTLTKTGTDDWTVEQWFAYWLEYIVKPFISDSGYDAYETATRLHIIPAIGKVRLKNLRTSNIEHVYVTMMNKTTRSGKPFKPGRIHQVHRTMKTALTQAVHRGYLTKNPALIARTPEVDDFEVEPYTIDEIKRLFAAAGKGRNAARWVIALSLGLRQGEVLGLRWEDIDWNNSTLRIRHSAKKPKYEHGCNPPCGRKYAGYCPEKINIRPVVGRTKSKAGRRPVPLPQSLVAMLKRHQADQEEEKRIAGNEWIDGGWMFTDERGKILSARTDWDKWKQLLAEASVRDARLHDARHTAATVLLILGVHERTVMSMLGWSSTSMAARYTHVVQPVHDQVAGQLETLLWKASPPAPEVKNGDRSGRSQKGN